MRIHYVLSINKSILECASFANFYDRKLYEKENYASEWFQKFKFFYTINC